MAEFFNTDDLYTSDLGSFSGMDPDVDCEKVSEYVAWKRSRFRHSIYRYALRHHWRHWYKSRVDNRWFMTPWYWLLELIMTNSQCNSMRGTLNRYELIRAGLQLGQYQHHYDSGWNGWDRAKAPFNGSFNG